MEKKARDYLTVTMAMLTILLCGYGIGYLVGEKEGRRSGKNTESPLELSGNWAEVTLTQLKTTLSLSPRQLKIAERKVAIASHELQKDLETIQQSRNRTLRKLYEDLASDLKPAQKIELEKLRQKLPASD